MVLIGVQVKFFESVMVGVQGQQVGCIGVRNEDDITWDQVAGIPISDEIQKDKYLQSKESVYS